MAYLLDIVPKYIEYVLLSDEYLDYISGLELRHGLSNEQALALSGVINDLLSKKVLVNNLTDVLLTRCSLNLETAKEITKELVLNLVIVFPDYFGDHSSYYRDLGGLPDDVQGSPTFHALMKYVVEKVKPRVDELDKIDVQTEAEKTVRFFSAGLVDFLKSPDGEYKASFDNMLLALLARREGFAQELIQSLLLNTELIGTHALLIENSRVSSSAANWLKDYIAFSGGDISTISTAKYLADSESVRYLDPTDREVLGKLLEVFRVLRTFPDSLSKVPPEQWQIIPYHFEEEAPTISSASLAVEEVSSPIAQATPLSEPAREASNVREPIPPAPSVVQAPSTMPIAPATAAPTIVQEQIQPPATSKATMEVASVPVPTSSATLPQYQSYADMVIERAGIFFGNDQIKKRVRSTVVTRLKDIRDPYELKAILVQAVDAGGAGLSEVQADQLVKEANIIHDDLRAGRVPQAIMPSAPTPQVTPSLQPKKLDQVVTTPSSAAQPVPLPLTPKTIEKPKSEMPISAPENLPFVPVKPVAAKKTEKPTNMPRLTIEEVDGVPTVVQKAVDDSVVSEQKRPMSEVSMPMTTIPPTPSPAVMPSIETSQSELGTSIPVIQRKTAPSAYKAGISDVKVSPRLVDPVEELRQFTLKDFRRLHSDPLEAAKRIYQKIQLLEKDSFARRQAGVSAWHENEISKLYQEIGTEVFRKGVPQDQVIASRMAAGLPTLSDKELDALMELNEMMSF